MLPAGLNAAPCLTTADQPPVVGPCSAGNEGGNDRFSQPSVVRACVHANVVAHAPCRQSHGHRFTNGTNSPRMAQVIKLEVLLLAAKPLAPVLGDAFRFERVVFPLAVVVQLAADVLQIQPLNQGCGQGHCGEHSGATPFLLTLI